MNTLTPIDRSRCPLCGQDNQCTATQPETSGVSCWCHAVTVTNDLLQRLPAEQRGDACICARCIAGDPARRE